MVEITEWDRGDTIRISNAYTDSSDSAYDPTSVELKIYDASGTLITTVTYLSGVIINDDVGTYHYDYNIPSDAIVGWWVTKWTAVENGFTDISKGQFKVGNPEEKLYCTHEEVWNRAGVDADVLAKDEVIPFIKDSMAEIDAMYAKKFSYANAMTEWFDTNRSDPNIQVSTVFLKYTPISSVTSVEEYDTTNTLVATHTSDDYWINLNTGTLRLTENEFVKQHHRVKIVYNYGAETIPQKISALCSVLSAMRLLIHQIGGTYDDVTSWSAAGLNISVGEPYMNMSRDIEFLNKEATRMMANIGRLRPSAIVL